MLRLDNNASALCFDVAVTKGVRCNGTNNVRLYTNRMLSCRVSDSNCRSRKTVRPYRVGQRSDSYSSSQGRPHYCHAVDLRKYECTEFDFPHDESMPRLKWWSLCVMIGSEVIMLLTILLSLSSALLPVGPDARSGSLHQTIFNAVGEEDC